MHWFAAQPRSGNFIDGYAWYLTQATNSSTPVIRDFEPIAARQWATHLSRYVKPDRLGELDTIHAITKDYGIVTPYSSMIVLVNNAQRQRLSKLKRADDRFNREVEDQQLPQPTSQMIPSAPKPAEWLLLIVGAIGLGFVYSRQKQLVE